MVIFNMKWRKYNEIQLKKQMDLNIRKITNHPPSPERREELVWKESSLYGKK